MRESSKVLASNGQKMQPWEAGMVLEGRVLGLSLWKYGQCLVFNDTTKADTLVLSIPAALRRAVGFWEKGAAMRIECLGKSPGSGGFPKWEFEVTRLENPGAPNYGPPPLKQESLDV